MFVIRSHRRTSFRCPPVRLAHWLPLAGSEVYIRHIQPSENSGKTFERSDPTLSLSIYIYISTSIPLSLSAFISTRLSFSLSLSLASLWRAYHDSDSFVLFLLGGRGGGRCGLLLRRNHGCGRRQHEALITPSQRTGARCGGRSHGLSGRHHEALITPSQGIGARCGGWSHGLSGRHCHNGHGLHRRDWLQSDGLSGRQKEGGGWGG